MDESPTAHLAPIPSKNAGAELTERPARWTRERLKIEEVEEETSGGLLKFFRADSKEEDDYVLGRRKEWKVDKRGWPMAVKIPVLVLGIGAILGVVWGFFYLLLKIVIWAN